MKQIAFDDLKCAALAHSLLLLLAAALLGEVVGSPEPMISAGGAGAILGWMMGIGVAHVIVVGAKMRGS